MTLPTSGPLSINDIKGEFGGPASPALSNYYAGGTYVPSGTTGTYGAVPTSGEISIRNFYGTSAAVIAFNYANPVAFASSGSATAAYRITTTGAAQQGVNGTFTTLEQGITPGSATSGYEVYATLVSGSLTSGTTGSWVSLGSVNVTWTLTRSTSGSSFATLSFDIRKIGTATVLDTWQVDLEAERL